MSKKIISSLLAVILLVVSLAGCGKKAEVKINGTNIDNEITAYFKAVAKDGEDVNSLIARYVAVNSEFNNHALSVPPSTRAALSENVNNIWHLFGGYYESLGISKETIYKIELSNVYKTLLLEEYYGKDGKAPVSEEYIKAFFRENYAAIRFVTGYLFEITESGRTEMSEAQKKKLTDAFTSAAEAINDGTGTEEAVKLSGSTEIRNTVVSSTGNDNFPDGFWNEVKKIEIGKAGVITLGGNIFLVQRVNAEEGEYECYAENRSSCLYKMKGEEFEKIIDSLAAQYKSN